MWIKEIRENPDALRADLKKRGEDAKVVDEILELDKKRSSLQKELDSLRHKRNEVTRKVAEVKAKGEDFSNLLREIKEIPKKIKAMEDELGDVEKKLNSLLMGLPNILDESVPLGESDEDNVPVKFFGHAIVRKEDAQRFIDESRGEMDYDIANFKILDHIDIGLKHDLFDLDRAAKVSGARFYYLKNELVILEQALIRFALDVLREKGFTLIEPPFMVHRAVEEGVTSFKDFEDVIYKVEGEDLYMIPTAEHPLAGYYMNEVLNESDLPIRLAGVSPCFRKEAGSHGKDTKGIFRVHQFNKIEQFVYCKPEDSKKEHEMLLANAEEIFQRLGIPYRVVNVCTGDLGPVAAKKYDIEAWLPGQGKFREVVSCSNCTDYQSRRLNIRYRKAPGQPAKYVHTLNSTALATTRAMIAILENYQQPDGTVRIPDALVKYTGFDVIG